MDLLSKMSDAWADIAFLKVSFMAAGDFVIVSSLSCMCVTEVNLSNAITKW